MMLAWFASPPSDEPIIPEEEELLKVLRAIYRDPSITTTKAMHQVRPQPHVPASASLVRRFAPDVLPVPWAHSRLFVRSGGARPAPEVDGQSEARAQAAGQGGRRSTGDNEPRAHARRRLRSVA